METVATGTRIQPNPLATEALVVVAAPTATVATVATVAMAESLASVAPEATAAGVVTVETVVTAVTQQSIQGGRRAARADKVAMPRWVMVALVEPVGRRRFRVLALRAKVVPVVMVDSRLTATAVSVVSVVLPMVSAQT